MFLALLSKDRKNVLKSTLLAVIITYPTIERLDYASLRPMLVAVEIIGRIFSSAALQLDVPSV
jgi:hypothetical protein